MTDSDSTDSADAPIACNIDRTGARRRALLGSVAGAATVAIAAWLLGGDAPRAFRLALFPPAFGAALGLLQVRAKT